MSVSIDARPGPAPVDLDLRAVPAELGRLAQLAASATGSLDTIVVEDRLAATLSTVRSALSTAPERAPATIHALVATACDSSRPLPRRVAALAELHHELAARHRLTDVPPGRSGTVRGDRE